MGACPSKCEIQCGTDIRYQGSVFELNLEDQYYSNQYQSNRSTLKQDGNETSYNTRAGTNKKERAYEDSQYMINQTPSLIQDEGQGSNPQAIPQFLRTKCINQSIIRPRENRFMRDLEIEVKARIRQIQMEEQKFLQEYLQMQEKIQQDEKKKKRLQSETQKQQQNQYKMDEVTSQKCVSECLSENNSQRIKFQKTKKLLEKLLSESIVQSNDKVHHKLIQMKKSILKKWSSLKYVPRSQSSRSQRSSSHNRKVHFSANTQFNERQSESIPSKWWRLF